MILLAFESQHRVVVEVERLDHGRKELVGSSSQLVLVDTHVQEGNVKQSRADVG